MLNTKLSMNMSHSLLMLVRLQFVLNGVVELWTGFLFLFKNIHRQKSFNNNNQTSNMKADKSIEVISKK